MAEINANLNTPAVFKPRYSFSHWMDLAFYPVIALTPGFINWLTGHRDSILYLDAEPTVLVAYGLVLVLCILFTLVFLASEHIRSIQVEEGGIVLRRLLGRDIHVEHSQVEWKNGVLRLGKRHAFALERVRNSNELMGLLPATLFQEPQGEQKGGWFQRLEASRWYNIIVILVVLLIAGGILAWGILKLSNSDNRELWALNGVLALADLGIATQLVLKLSAKP